MLSLSRNSYRSLGLQFQKLPPGGVCVDCAGIPQQAQPWLPRPPWPLSLILFLSAGFKMFAVGVGNAVEDELREIASEPVAEHYFYTADFKTIDQIGKKLQKKICVG